VEEVTEGKVDALAESLKLPLSVISVRTAFRIGLLHKSPWIPAFAGMTSFCEAVDVEKPRSPAS
jgi:hypothetical protein